MVKILKPIDDSFEDFQDVGIDIITINPLGNWFVPLPPESPAWGGGVPIPGRPGS